MKITVKQLEALRPSDAGKTIRETGGLVGKGASRKWVSCRSVFPLSSGSNRGSESTRVASLVSG